MGSPTPFRLYFYFMEIWKDIKGFEGMYQASYCGKIKSLERLDPLGRPVVERILKQKINKDGYCHVRLFKNGSGKTRKVHQIIAVVFLDHVVNGFESVINHKDFNKQNNSADNLEITTQRINANLKHVPHSSKYTGVWFRKDRNSWGSNIRINGRTKHLGTFDSEYEAHLAYEKALSEINN